MSKIAIYAAHGKGESGGYDPGAINTRLGLQEHKISVALCKATYEALAGYDCEVYTYNLDGEMSLKDMIAHANAHKFDVVITEHLNAHTSNAYGTEAYYYPNNKVGRAVADAICKELSKALEIPQRSNGIDDGGDKSSIYFGWVRQTKAPAVLLETCFITTDGEAKKVDEPREQKAVGQAIARGIAKGMALKQKPVAVPPAKYKVVTGTFPNKKDAQSVYDFLKARKLYAEIKTVDGGYVVWSYSYDTEARAQEVVAALKTFGIWSEKSLM